ncbi:MAG: hypothetical protein IKF05_09225 [Erysipelotrichaceae bacterium]|nr:hypothetical protein [Erysipelotrichaceae bacterium]
MITVGYDYYISEYGGQKINRDFDFDSYVKDAQNYLITLTGGAYIGFEFADEDVVKDCLCALADYGYDEAIRLEKNGVASESVGGHSRSYNTAATAKTIAEVNAEKKNIALAYLLRTGIFYRGVL